jgi:hypothetical protein
MHLMAPRKPLRQADDVSGVTAAVAVVKIREEELHRPGSVLAEAEF